MQLLFASSLGALVVVVDVDVFSDLHIVPISDGVKFKYAGAGVVIAGVVIAGVVIAGVGVVIAGADIVKHSIYSFNIIYSHLYKNFNNF